MSQTYTADCFAGSHEAQTDLTNMEANFAALKSMFSGASAPSNTLAGMPWFDTTKKVLKYRNNGDSAWVGVMHGDTSQKIWVYRNTAMDGWAIDGTVTDTVLALKGGSVYTAGAIVAGTWTIGGLTDSGHTHAAGSYAGPNHTHTATSGAPSATTAVNAEGATLVGSETHTHSITTGNPSATALTGTSASGTSTIASDASWRASAAIGTLQYLDL